MDRIDCTSGLRMAYKLGMHLAWVSSMLCMALANAAAEPSRSVTLSPCQLPDVTRPARCGTFEVPENPDRPNGRRLGISIVVVPASGGTALSDPIVPLMGGPAEEARSVAAIFARNFASLLNDRDLVLIDQRGTGRSAPLRCDLSAADDPAANLREFMPLAAIERCREQLSTRADLTQYTYPHFAKDLEQIRRALGYGKLNLFAGSYGTRAAQVYVRAYPQSVRTVYMGSIVPLDVATPVPFAKAVQAAFEKTFDACAAESACRSAFPNLREEFTQVLARLGAGVRVKVPGAAEPVQLHRGRVVEWLRAVMYRAAGAATVPWLIHRAYGGDWQPIVDGIMSNARSRGPDSEVSFGLFFAITCNDDVAFIREEEVEPATQGTFLGDYRIRQQQAACKDWPKLTHAADYRKPVRSSVPTLFVSGDIDPTAPLWYTERTAPGFSDRVQVVQHEQGHTEWNECVERLYHRFVSSGATRGLDASCKPVARPPFKIEGSS